jgi:hypothetical protein
VTSKLILGMHINMALVLCSYSYKLQHYRLFVNETLMIFFFLSLGN